MKKNKIIAFLVAAATALTCASNVFALEYRTCKP